MSLLENSKAHDTFWSSALNLAFSQDVIGSSYGANNLTASPNGRWVFANNNHLGDREIILAWDLENNPPVVDRNTELTFTSNQPVRIGLSDTQDVITSVATDSSSKWLALTSTSGHVKIYQLDGSWEEYDSFDYGVFLRAAEFHPDGKRLIIGSADNTVTLFYFKIRDLIEKACEQVVREFSLEEWSTYFPGEEYRTVCGKLE